MINHRIYDSDMMKKILFLFDKISDDLCYIRYLDDQLDLPIKTIEHIEYLCMIHGRSIKGCLTSSHYFLGNIKKNPLYINKYICLFMVKVNRGQDQLWLNATMIIKIDRINDHLSNIIFYKQHQMIIDVSVRSLKKQLDRSFILQKMINDQM